MKGNVRKYEIADAMLVNVDAVMGIAHHALRFVARGLDVRTTSALLHAIEVPALLALSW